MSSLGLLDHAARRLAHAGVRILVEHLLGELDHRLVLGDQVARRTSRSASAPSAAISASHCAGVGIPGICA